MNNLEKPVAYLSSVNFNSKPNEQIPHTSNTKRSISVNAAGEFSLPPDKVKLTVVIKSIKENINDAKQSVIRRYDYVYQTLRKNRIKVLFKLQ